MAETFLEEQLKRIRQMSEQMSRARDYAAEVSNEVARERESMFRHHPLHEVRDYRPYSSIDEAPRRPAAHNGRGHRPARVSSCRRR
jgi:hypothetical protein